MQRADAGANQNLKQSIEAFDPGLLSLCPNGSTHTQRSRAQRCKHPLFCATALATRDSARRRTSRWVEEVKIKELDRLVVCWCAKELTRSHTKTRSARRRQKRRRLTTTRASRSRRSRCRSARSRSPSSSRSSAAPASCLPGCTSRSACSARSRRCVFGGGCVRARVCVCGRRRRRRGALGVRARATTPSPNENKNNHTKQEIGFTLVGLLTLLPGAHHTWIALQCWRKAPGYRWSDIPST